MVDVLHMKGMWRKKGTGDLHLATISVFCSVWWRCGRKSFSSCLFLRYSKSQNWSSWRDSNHMTWSQLLKCLAGPDQFQPAHAALCLECRGAISTFTFMLGVECAKSTALLTSGVLYPLLNDHGIYKPCFPITCLTWYFLFTYLILLRKIHSWVYTWPIFCLAWLIGYVWLFVWFFF